ncbi:hypothetical protein SteCoe_14211 [Stentor coeruleus]|uniref:Uncharacterized protein n=1 Tax=Stentor coeruleus TaxID=5963 RepID=A0A1R2C6M0_9CILI|nr:hypothetical protein SteCoe_14211 [Stentor coeruleus]
MGCQSSMCADSTELILSQPLGGKFIDVNFPVSEKSTNLSINTLQRREKEKNTESARKFYLLKSVIKISLRDLKNFNDLSKISEIWVNEIYRVMEESSILAEDLKTIVSVNSRGDSLTIKHELDGVRNFDMIKTFYTKILPYTDKEFDFSNYQSNESFLTSLCPLTIFFYLKLGYEIDFGIGVEKPMDRKQMALFLTSCNEAGNITTWASLNNQPIPISCSFSVVSKTKVLTFYIFDGLKNQNIDRGFSLFEEFGAPAGKDVERMFRINTADEVYCSLEFDDKAIRTISLLIQNEEICEHMLGVVDANPDVLKWNAFHSLLPGRLVGIDLTSDGFVLKKISSL